MTNIAAYQLLLAFIVSLVFVEGYKDYRNFKIYEINARNNSNQRWLGRLRKISGIEVLKHDQKSAKVLVQPQHLQDFGEIVNSDDLHYSIITDNLAESWIEAKHAESRSTQQGHFNAFEDFYRHAEINEHLDTLHKEYPSRVFVKNFGRTHERRCLKTITITNGDGRANKHVILIDAAMHAREWITTSMALHIIDELITNYEAHVELLRDYDWVLVPVLNADGYEYTHTEDRMWRRTRKPHQSQECIGTDLNRNFDFEWGLEEGSSSEPCEDIYKGPSPFSEPEAQVLRDIMLTYGSRLKFYLSLHSYGNYLLLPWGHTGDLPDGYSKMMDVAEKGALAIVSATGTSYTYGSMNYILYPVAGDATDYAHGALNTPITISMELPAGGITGFDPAVREIEHFVTESWTGIKAMAFEVVKSFPSN